MITAETILQDVEPLPHVGRVQHMITLGRRAAAEPEVAAALAKLADGDFMMRYLALFSCFTSGDRGQVLRALADPSRLIRGLAARLMPIVGTPADFARALEIVAPQARVTLLWRLRKRHLTNIIDAYLATPAAQSDPQFRLLLPFGSVDFVRQQQDRIMQSSDVEAWLRLARLHPGLALESLEARVHTRGMNDDTSTIFYTLLPLLGEAQEERVLALLTAYIPSHAIYYRKLQPLVARYPRALASFVLATANNTDYISLNFTGAVAQLTTEQIVALVRHHANTLGYDFSWLSQLPPAMRVDIFEALQTYFRDRQISSVALATLPANLRLREARRIVGDMAISSRVRLRYALFLPWEEALAILNDAMHSSNAAERQESLQTLIAATRYHSDHLGEMLEMLQERRNEQDPVRGMMLGAVADLPPSRWQPDHLPLLGELIRHGLNDVGLSENTRQAILRLLLRVAPFHTTWATEQIATVMRERGFARLNWPLDGLPSATRDAVFAAVLPVVSSWVSRGHTREALQALTYFVTASGGLPDDVDSMLLSILDTTQDLTIAGEILDLLRDYRHARFTELVSALVGVDASWIACPLVSSYLLRHRQDLLTPFLSYQHHAGRFASDGQRYLLSITSSAASLTTSQQETYAATLDAIIADPEQGSVMQVRAIRALALLPGIGLARLAALANHPSTIFRTTALLALGHADTDEGLPTIREALQDSRGRIAILALQRFLRDMPPAEALALLRAVPLTRVTLAKTVVRMIAAVPIEEAFQALLALAGNDLHRDVRVVVLEMLWHFPARAEIWPIMTTGLQSETKEIASAALPPRGLLINAALLRRPIADVTLHTRALELLRTGIAYPHTEVRDDALRLCQHVALPDAAAIVVPLLIERARIAPGDDVHMLGTTLFALCATTEADAVAALFATRQTQRQILNDLTGTLTSALGKHRERLLPTCRAVLATLAADPVLVTLRATLAFDALPPGEFLAFLNDAARDDLLHADALHAICTRIDSNSRRFTVAEWDELYAPLATSADARLRRIAFAVLLAQVGRGNDQWTPERIAALRAFRADPAPLVAAAAQFHLVPPVDTPESAEQ